MKKILFFIFLLLPLAFIAGGFVGWFYTNNEVYFIIFILLLVPLDIIACYICFGIITKSYPHNDLNDYNINIRSEIPLNISNDTLFVRIVEVKKGIWIFQSVSGIRIFNLVGYIFPKYFIAAYFFRAYNYVEINKKKIKWKALGKSIKLSYLKNYNNVILNFISVRGKNSDIVIVKDSRTKRKFAISEIIWANYFDVLLDRRWGSANKFKKYKELNEIEYQRDNKSNKPSIINDYQNISIEF